jgi:hypothetical protein
MLNEPSSVTSGTIKKILHHHELSWLPSLHGYAVGYKSDFIHTPCPLSNRWLGHAVSKELLTSLRKRGLACVVISLWNVARAVVAMAASFTFDGFGHERSSRRGFIRLRMKTDVHASDTCRHIFSDAGLLCGTYTGRNENCPHTH